ncbi:alpha/beta hydrolase family protein [Micromonospora tarensis]|uniref:Alpha/beta fold hydrolase n=1 Tax=Micromonospora tarensis TaxID=2806100 RepID=A0ABS1YR38_9ACTN|nr:alpha/beta fold hydrolase [Micromonospora tarensis]MBM0279903.1 alpha/beta fold hydrolase [Micromonospora tarensis]
MNVADFAAFNFSRATGAGLDPHEYLRRTAALREPATGRRRSGGPARSTWTGPRRRTAPVTSGEYHQLAARWFTPPPCCRSPAGPGRRRPRPAPTRRWAARSRLLEPDARRITGPDFAGWLRDPADPADPAMTVVIIPGLDSSKEEFHAVAAALLRRGAAVFAMDGPGQGVLAATTRVRSDYHQVMRRVLDRLGADRVGLVGLSLGGYHAAETAAHEPRVAATVTVSGPFRLDWAAMPPFFHDLLTQRAGGTDAARRFADQLDLTGLAARITTPLLVVDGGQDVIPGVTNGESLARLATRGEYRCIEHADHLLGNAQPDWLPPAADWLLDHLTTPAGRTSA